MPGSPKRARPAPPPTPAPGAGKRSATAASATAASGTARRASAPRTSGPLASEPRGVKQSAAATGDAPLKSALETQDILARLYGQHPNATTELDFTTPFELLVATILSAQSSDKRVNEVTPALFKRYPTPGDLAAAKTE